MPLTAPKTRRYKDIHILYTSDFNRDYIFSQRRYAIPRNNGDIPPMGFDNPVNKPTPITNSFLARVRSNPGKKPRVKPFEPRSAIAYYAHNNKQGYLQRSVIIPYTPSQSEFTIHFREILNYRGVECADYKGESHENTGLLYSDVQP